MAYPGEQDHVDFLQYAERVANGEEPGPQLSKEEFLKRRRLQAAVEKQEGKKSQTTSVLTKE